MRTQDAADSGCRRFTDQPVDNPEIVSHSAGLLQKPFSASTLLDRIAEALTGGRDTPV